ncbi:MAG: putative DNA binding domain-containing protein [Thermoguttaceae bacterium]|nr:putative DNA binding domain-containing protein [Thermoguttaceae bacterium]
MTRVNIGRETERIEYKKSTGELKEGVVSIVAMLNKHGGGELYFGVKNNGDVIGQEIADSTLRDVSQAVANHIKPVIYPEITARKYGDLEVVYVRFEGNRAPYLAYNIPRIRVADEDKVMDQETYDEALRKRGDSLNAWELQTSEYTIDDVVDADFRRYLRKAKEIGRIEFESDEPSVVLEKLELLAKDGRRLLNAGAVLFCSSSMNDVQMAKFATNVKTTFTDIRREDRGTIFGLCRTCEQYIIDAMDWKAEIVGLKRVETPEIPLEAIREAIVNSYGHRLYNNNQCNEIDVFKDRIEIHTTGGFPQGHSPEEFLDGKKKAVRRNKLITRVLYFSKDMETFATGLKRIKDLCDEAGCKVEFRAEKDDFVVAFYRNLRENWNSDGNEVKLSDNKTNRGVNGGNRGGNRGGNHGGNHGGNRDANRGGNRDANHDANKPNSSLFEIDSKLTKRVIKVLQKKPKITQSELASLLDVSIRTVQRTIAALKEDGRIERVGGTRGEWAVKKKS